MEDDSAQVNQEIVREVVVNPVDQNRIEQNIRQGTLVYLQDILSIEFSLVRLKRCLNKDELPVYLHENEDIAKCYRLPCPYITLAYEDDNKYLQLSYTPKNRKYYFRFEVRDRLRNGTGCDGVEFFHDCKGKFLNQEMRRKLCTVPEFKRGLFAPPDPVNLDSIYYVEKYYVRSNWEQYGAAAYTQIEPIIENFESFIQEYEGRYQKNLPGRMQQINAVKSEIEQAEKIRDDLYSLNIIPSKYRNLGCIYFIHEYFSTSDTPLNEVFMHLDLDKIQTQLETVIKNQEEIILQQAMIISQNTQMIQQNERTFKELSDMNTSLQNTNSTLGKIYENSIETAKWARIGAIHAQECAWFGYANYLN